MECANDYASSAVRTRDFLFEKYKESLKAWEGVEEFKLLLAHENRKVRLRAKWEAQGLSVDEACLDAKARRMEAVNRERMAQRTARAEANV